MRWLQAFGDVLDWMGRWVASLALLGLLVIVMLQAIDRHFIDVPIAAPDAYARIMVIWLTFVGFALAGRAGLAIRVDLVDQWLPRRVLIALEVVFDLAKLAILGLLIVKGWLLVEIGFYQSILGTNFTTAVPNSGLWVGSIMLFVFVAIALIRALFGRDEPIQDHKAESRAE
jgi:TRAP-type C4-dicarboxylate transport system permease small subunit